MIKIDIVGLGNGSYHMRAIGDLPGVEVNRICDIAPEQIKKVVDEFHTPADKCFTDFDKMLKDTEADAIIISTPENFHCDMTCKALRAGKAVLCEKPLALHADECQKMIQTAKETGSILMVGQVCRVTPGFIRAKEFIDKGLIGDVFFIESEYAHNYTHSAGYNNWRKDPALKRHPVTGGGCHAVDLIRWLTGQEPEEVFAYSTHVNLTDWPCDDTTIAIAKFSDKLTGKIFVSTGCQRRYTMRTVIYGTKGTIICDNTTPEVSLFLGEVDGNEKFLGHSARNTAMQFHVELNSHNFKDEIKELCECIVNHTQPAISAEEGMKTVAFCEAIVRSTETGMPVKPQKF